MKTGVILAMACLMLAALALAGCSPLAMQGVAYDLNSLTPDKTALNGQLASTTEEVKDAWGQNSRVTTSWQVQDGRWVKVGSHKASGAGIGQTAVTAVAGSAPYIPAAALIRPSNVNQTGGGADATGGTASATQKQGQLQGQKQDQKALGGDGGTGIGIGIGGEPGKGHRD
jgi:hypothetical protein